MLLFEPGQGDATTDFDIRRLAVWQGLSKPLGQVHDVYPVASSQNYRALHNIPQFAQVARPGISVQRRHRLLRETGDPFGALLGEECQTTVGH